jgi:ABC-type lipoprotein export system ATPase subunit
MGIMVTHDLNMARLADGILEMRDGRISRAPAIGDREVQTRSA